MFIARQANNFQMTLFIRSANFPKIILQFRLLASATLYEHRAVRGHWVLSPQSLRFDAFLIFQLFTKSGAVRWPPSTQDDFHFTRYCLRGLPRPCFIFLSVNNLSFPTLLLVDRRLSEIVRPHIPTYHHRLYVSQSLLSRKRRAEDLRVGGVWHVYSC